MLSVAGLKLLAPNAAVFSVWAEEPRNPLCCCAKGAVTATLVSDIYKRGLAHSDEPRKSVLNGQEGTKNGSSDIPMLDRQPQQGAKPQ